MDLISIDDAGAAELLQLPESGMGFQLVEATFWGAPKRLLVFNVQTALDLSELPLDFAADTGTIATNGARIVEALKTARLTMIAAPGPRNFRLLASRIPTGSVSTSSAVVTASALVKHVVLTAVRTFHRFSAFKPDRRVDLKTGDFLPGTYAAPVSEVPLVPTGFAAVGRFALPNNAPASHHYVINAGAQTAVSFGTVAPAFSQAGGGVEAFFPGGATNQPPNVPPSRIDDE